MASPVRDSQERKEPKPSDKKNEVKIPSLGDIIDRTMPSLEILKQIGNSLDNRAIVIIKGNYEAALLEKR